MSEQGSVVIDPSGRDIHGEAARLRERGPVARVELPGGVGAWAVSSTDLLKRLLTDPRVSKDPRQHWPLWINGEISPEWPLFTWVAVQNMFTAYGGELKRLRTLVSKAFTARRTAALQPRIEEITKQLLDRIDEAGRRSEVVDLREEFCYPLPIQVISELCGLPEEKGAELRAVVVGVFNTAATPEEVTDIYARLYAALGELVAAKRESPGDDLTSGLIAARDDEGDTRLSEQELLDTLVLMISAIVGGDQQRDQVQGVAGRVGAAVRDDVRPHQFPSGSPGRCHAGLPARVLTGRAGHFLAEPVDEFVHAVGDRLHVHVFDGGHGEVGALPGGHEEDVAVRELDQRLPPGGLRAAAELGRAAADRLDAGEPGREPFGVVPADAAEWARSMPSAESRIACRASGTLRTSSSIQPSLREMRTGGR